MEAIAIAGLLYFAINRWLRRYHVRDAKKRAERRRETVLRRRALENTGHTVLINADNHKIAYYYKRPATLERGVGSPGSSDLSET